MMKSLKLVVSLTWNYLHLDKNVTSFEIKLQEFHEHIKIQRNIKTCVKVQDFRFYQWYECKWKWSWLLRSVAVMEMEALRTSEPLLHNQNTTQRNNTINSKSSTYVSTSHCYARANSILCSACY